MLPAAKAEPIVTNLGLPATADEWLESRGHELDWRLKRFAYRLARSQLDGVELREGRLYIRPIRTAPQPEVKALGARLDAMLPRVRVTELLHEVARGTGFLGTFTNFRRPALTRTRSWAPSSQTPPTLGWAAWPRPARA